MYRAPFLYANPSAFNVNLLAFNVNYIVSCADVRKNNLPLPCDMKRLTLVWMVVFCAMAAWSQETTGSTLDSDEDSLSLPPIQLVPSDMGLSKAVFPEINLRQT